MFKVECPECSAPYQVDERRVPATGVNMRCPKCRTAFVVHKPGDEPGDTGGKPVARESNRPRGDGQDSTTMLGVAAPVQRRVPRPDDRAAAAPPPPRRVAPPRPGGAGAKRAPAASASSFAELEAELPAPSRRGTSPGATVERASEPALPGVVDEASETGDGAGLPSVVSDEPGLPSVPPSDRAALPSIPPSDRPGLPSLPPSDRPGLPSLRPRRPLAGGGSARVPSEPPASSFDFSFGELEQAAVSDAEPSAGERATSEAPRRPAIPHPGTAQRPRGGGQREVEESPPERPPAHIDSVMPLSDSDLSSVPPTPEERASPSGFALDDALELPSPAADFEEELARRFQPEDPGDFRMPSDVPRAPGSASSEVEALALDDVQIEEVASFDPRSLPELPDLERGPSHRSGATVLDEGDLGDFEDDMFTLESAPPSRAAGASQAAAAASSDAFDAFLEDSSPIAFEQGAGSGGAKARPTVAEPGRSAGDYGEVDLPGADSSPPLDVGADLEADVGEFGAIPQEQEAASLRGHDTREPETPPERVGGAAAATAPVDSAKPAEAEAPSSNLGKWLLAGVLLTAIGGGALALVPDVGPFGIHFISDTLNADRHQQLLGKTVQQVVELRQRDSYAGVPEVIATCDAASEQAPRFASLTAYAAYARLSSVVRFGSQPEMQASAKVLLDGLLGKGADAAVPYVSLAQAAQASLAGDDDGARRALSRAQSSFDAQVLDAELALARGDGAAAVQVWEQAVAELPSAWTNHGLARARLMQAQYPEARALAQATLKLNEEHAGARLVLARCERAESNESAALERLQELLERPALASPAELVQAHTLVGEIHLSRGRLAKAQAAFEAALALEPKALLATVGLGETHFAAGRYAAALGRFEVAARDEQGPLEAELGLVKAFIALERLEKAKQQLAALQTEHGKDPRVGFWTAKLAAAAGENDKAEAAYRAAIEAGGDKPIVVSAYVALAQVFSQSGKLSEAQELLSAAQRKFPQSVLLRNSQGQVAMSQGRYEAALAEFRAARKLDPDDVTAVFNEGSALRRLRRFEDAWKAFEVVAELDRDLPGLPLERGLLLEQSGRGKEALKEYELALARAPEDPDLKLRVGCGRVAAGEGKAAEKILDEVVKQRARVSEVHHCLGRALFLQERNLEALKRLQAAAELDPNRAEYHMYVGWVANEAGQVALAKRALNTALSLDQGLADAYWQRGVLSLRQGGPGDAIIDIKRALELRPSRFEAHADLAQAYYQMGKLNDALSHWQKALAAEGDNPTWLFRYGKLLHSLHRAADAATALERAIELGSKADAPPAWLWEAHHLAAASLGRGARALEHWRRFLELGPKDSPYRSDAKRALRQAGTPWRGD